MIELLLRRGADLFESYNSPASCYKDVDRHVMTVLWNDTDVQKRAEEKLGMTRLHIACYLKNEEAIRSILNDDAAIDVNGQVRVDCLPFAGSTPMHLLFDAIDSFYNQNLHISESMVNVLLDRGADVTVVNNSKDSPIHVLYKFERYLRTNGNRYMSLLLKAISDFSVNPANSEEFSHYHLACLFHEEEVVEKFLQNGVVDVNRPTGFYARNNPGCTPLHLALSLVLDDDWAKLTRIVDLLLKHGAEVAAEDVYGDTPLHEPAALHSPGMIMFEKLVSCEADMKRANVEGLTPLVKLSNENPDGYARVCQKYNCRADYWNRLTGEGYIGKQLISRNGNVAGNSEFHALLQSSDLQTVDKLGRSAIHNAVAAIERVYEKLPDYIYAIKGILERGTDIDHQDNFGRTALHYAAMMQNRPGTNALLSCGADIDIVDSTGQSAFSYAMVHVRSGNDLWVGYPRRVVAIGLRLHVQKLIYLGIEVSQLNRNLAREFQQRLDHKDDDDFDSSDKSIELSGKFFNQIELSKSVDIGVRSLTLFGFLSDTSVVTLYPCLPASDQIVIDDFFKSRDFSELKQISGIFKLQFTKMKRRLALLDSALYALRTLFGFSIPGLCEEITRFLTYSDLKSLIAATTIED